MEYTVQVSLARVLNKLDIYEGRSQFVSWVDKIAVRIALKEWRRLRWRDLPLGVAEKEGSNDRPLSLFGLPNRSPLSLSKLDDLRQHIQPILVKENKFPASSISPLRPMKEVSWRGDYD